MKGGAKIICGYTGKVRLDGLRKNLVSSQKLEILIIGLLPRVNIGRLTQEWRTYFTWMGSLIQIQYIRAFLKIPPGKRGKARQKQNAWC
ncbi:MAG: hypothetical protein V7K48_10565 [Nostoc sp.]|uniref:hypothetical protein n=1 Tax=Nostoc sp. TaxID=1180 RepID=UPI002FF58BA6